jgi:hypothetical protein
MAYAPKNGHLYPRQLGHSADNSTRFQKDRGGGTEYYRNTDSLQGAWWVGLNPRDQRTPHWPVANSGSPRHPEALQLQRYEEHSGPHWYQEASLPQWPRETSLPPQSEISTEVTGDSSSSGSVDQARIATGYRAVRNTYIVAMGYYNSYRRPAQSFGIRRVSVNDTQIGEFLDSIYRSASLTTENYLRLFGIPSAFIVMRMLWQMNPNYAPHDFNMVRVDVQQRLNQLDEEELYLAHAFGSLFALLYLIQLPTRIYGASGQRGERGDYDGSEYSLAQLGIFNDSYRILEDRDKEHVWRTLFRLKHNGLSIMYEPLPPETHPDIYDCVAKFRNVLGAFPVPLGL